jgi:hypothetical protein
VIVVKFGGTSVGDAESIERAAEIVKGRLARQPARRRLGARRSDELTVGNGEQSARVI